MAACGIKILHVKLSEGEMIYIPGGIHWASIDAGTCFLYNILILLSNIFPHKSGANISSSVHYAHPELPDIRLIIEGNRIASLNDTCTLCSSNNIKDINWFILGLDNEEKKNKDEATETLSNYKQHFPEKYLNGKDGKLYEGKVFGQKLDSTAIFGCYEPIYHMGQEVAFVDYWTNYILPGKIMSRSFNCDQNIIQPLYTINVLPNDLFGAKIGSHFQITEFKVLEQHILYALKTGDKRKLRQNYKKVKAPCDK